MELKLLKRTEQVLRKNNSYSIIVVILALVFANTTSFFAQNLKKDLLAINAAYKNANKLSFVMELDMYENYTSNKLYYSQKVSMKKNGKTTLHSSDETESMNTPDYTIIKDDEEKLITYAPKKTVQQTDDVSFMMNVDSLGSLCKSFKFNKESATTNSYDFIMQDYYPNYERIKIFYNVKTHFIEKMIFYCDEDDISIHNEDEKYARARIEINYNNIDTNPSFKDSDFSYQKYMQKKGNKFELNADFKKYELSVLSF